MPPLSDSRGFKQLRWFEAQCVEHLACTWKKVDIISQISSLSMNESESPSTEERQLATLLHYIQNVQEGQTELTWDHFSALVQPFFRTWTIPLEPKYLGPIDALTKDVLARLGRGDSPQYALIRDLILLPTKDNKHAETVDYFKEIIGHCTNLTRVDLGLSQMPMQPYRELIQAFTAQHHIRQTLHELAVDLYFDSSDAHVQDVLHPAIFFAEFKKQLNGYKRVPIILKLGRLTLDGAHEKPVEGEAIGRLAEQIPQEVVDINFDFLIKNLGDAMRRFPKAAPAGAAGAALLEKAAFGSKTWGFAMYTLEDVGRCVQALTGSEVQPAAGMAALGLNLKVHAPFGQLDDKHLVGLEQLTDLQLNGTEPAKFFRIVNDVFGEFFGGIKVIVPMNGDKDGPVKFFDYDRATETLSRIPARYRIVVHVPHSFDGAEWAMPFEAAAFYHELSRRHDVEFRLGDQAELTLANRPWPARLRGSFEAFLATVLPSMQSLKCLTIAFDKTMHRTRHSFGEVAAVLGATLPDLCGRHSLRTLTLNLGQKSGWPDPQTQDWLSGNLPASSLEESMEPHIPHISRFLRNLTNLTHLEILHLEIITPGHYHWLLHALPAMLPKSTTRLALNHTRFCTTHAGAAARPPGPTEPEHPGPGPVMLQLGRDGAGLGAVSSYLEWQGELVARVRREMVTAAQARGEVEVEMGLPGNANAGLSVRLGEVAFWGADSEAKGVLGGRYFPPFCRQRRSVIRRAWRHIHRGEGEGGDEL